MRKLLLTFTLAAFTLTGCASTPQGKLHQAAEIQKISVDGLGNTYLDVCEQVVKPKCVAENDAAKEAGKPWTKEERIACLKPCDSDTASKIKTALDAVIAAQLVIYGLLKSGESDESKLKAARAELREAGERLLQVLEDLGARDFIESKLFGS